MESMKSAEANSSHHQNKVAVNSIATESNKQSIGSSSSSLNNNKLNLNQQIIKTSTTNQQLSTTKSTDQIKALATTTPSSGASSISSESKDTNFEYDDNEWDVGGIGDLLIDLDADIEKSSSTQVGNSNNNNNNNNNTGGGDSITNTAISSNTQQLIEIKTKTNNQQQLNEKISSSTIAQQNNLTSSSSSTSSPSSKSTGSNILLSSQQQQQAQLLQEQEEQKQEQKDSNNSLTSGANQNTKIGGNLKSTPTKQQQAKVAQPQQLPPQQQTKSVQQQQLQQHQQQGKATQQPQNLKLQQPSLVAQLTSGSKLSSSSSAKLLNLNSNTGPNKNQVTVGQTKTLLKPAAASANQIGGQQQSTITIGQSSMSQAGGGSQNSAGGKSNVNQKMSIDHQATLDKGLKMKIKRTKPGTKTSEAKHEIVKAEQNGLSPVDESSATNANQQVVGGKNKHNQLTGSPQVTQALQTPNVAATTAAANKRGSSSHRQHKQRDKTPHSRPDKLDHSSNNSNSNSNSSSSGNSCNCSNEMNGNSNAPLICPNPICIRNQTDSRPISQSRINTNLNSINNSSGGIFIQSTVQKNTNLNNIQPSSSGVPNSPGLPSQKITSIDTKLSNQSTTPQILPNNQDTNTMHIPNSGQVTNTKIVPSGVISATVHHAVPNKDDGTLSPPAKKSKSESKEMVDMCVGTSVGTITEPDCLGPCEPGTSVTLEGIVWHETEGGVLVVNVTWRGKTYVGTLLDCTRHDWAPPRFCDSPTEELDSRTPKGRAKRGRSANLAPDLMNFTETRTSVHSKLRNGGPKGRGGRTTASSTNTTSTTTTTTSGSGASANGTTTTTTQSAISSFVAAIANATNTPSTSPTSFLTPRGEKRKSKDECPSPVNGESNSSESQIIVNPITGLNVQISTKKCKTASPCPISPVLLECPEQDCNKKYKHANGLRYHQSHAHGSGSMDEDSSTLPESPGRIAPPTTPSPAPPTSTTPQPTVSGGSSSTPVPSPGTVSVTTPPVTSIISTNNNSGGLLATTTILSSISTSNAPILSTASVNQTPTIPGGSITAGISGQALSQHQQQQQQQILVGNVPNQGIIENVPATPQQNHTSIVHGNLGTPSRGDAPIKPGVLRFGPPPNDVSLSSNNSQIQQSPLRPTPQAATAPNSGSSVGPDSAHQISFNQNQAASQGIPVSKSQSFGKQKKNRKSPVPGEFNSSSRDDTHSPAYSDISDEVNEAEISDKSQPPKTSDAKKLQEGGPPPQMQTLGGYGMYPFYSQQPYMVPQDGGPPKPSLPPSSLSSSSVPGDYGKNKDGPPLDLMTNKPNDPKDNSNISSGPVSSSQIGQPPIGMGGQPPPQGPGPTKPMSHFYPFNYMPPGYPYDPNYGPVSMVSDENPKLGPPPGSQPPPLKEDRTKESPSPHGSHDSHSKISNQPQIIPTKLIKTEPKDIKQEPSSHVVHPKESPVQSLGPYSGLYQRHSSITSSSQQPPPQHMSRDDELRRYYIYSDQRRNNPPTNSSQITVKDEPPSPSQTLHHPIPVSQQSQIQLPSPQQQQQKNKSLSQQNQKPTNLIKDQKDEKESKIIKQEGQKPTMETQGPPPPPTSQYFLHPSYISPGPFGFDPNHPMYRNVLMSANPYSAPSPYHLPMPRFHAPEDLSRGNPGTKALDALHHAASQYYNTHKIHELSERAMKSPSNSNNNCSGPGNNSGNKGNVSSPNIQQPGSGMNQSSLPPNTNSGAASSGPPPNLLPPSQSSGPLNMQPPPGSLPPGMTGPLSTSSGPQKPGLDGKPPSSDPKQANSGGPPGSGPSGPGGPDSRSPPPQRHVHTHHHTHVGLGYPMYPAPYGAAVLASQQAAAVAVINPFPPGPTK